ncbi:essential cell division FtsK domain protein [Escherichia coli DEC9E]|nr:essential cell division FtsK domain protein [Escherichia coli DEC9E]
MMRPIPDPYWKPGDSMDAQHPVLKKNHTLWCWLTNLPT